MCRHVAYLGPPATLGSLLIDPPHSLYRQSWAPRRQRHGTVNADGFGIGWYADGDPRPARYRRGGPIWGDSSLPDIARVTRSAAVLAAVRSATAGMAAGEQAAAPFGDGPWLFSHNGRLDGWPASAARLAGGWLTDGPAGAGSGSGARDGRAGTGAGDQAGAHAALQAALSVEAMVDSAFLWALVLGRLRAGRSPGDALEQVTAAVTAGGGTGRLNFLLTDGHTVAATAWGDTLWYREGPGPAVLVASEPSDDGPGWAEVPDRHLVTATPDGVRLRPLASAAPPDQEPGSGPGGALAPARVPAADDASTEGITA
jgi:glutamine amidotransferase